MLTSSAVDISEKVRSAAREKELDRKIEQIERENRIIEKKQKLREKEAKTFGLPKMCVARAEDGNHLLRKSKVLELPPAVVPQAQRQKNNSKNFFATAHQSRKFRENVENHQLLKQSDQKWSREWDSGKLPTEQWKINVPEVAKNQKVVTGLRAYNSTFESNPHARGRIFRSKRNFLKTESEMNQNFKLAAPRNSGFFHDDRLVEGQEKTTLANGNGKHKTNPRRRDFYLKKNQDDPNHVNLTTKTNASHRLNYRRPNQKSYNNVSVNTSTNLPEKIKCEATDLEKGKPKNRRKPKNAKNRQNLVIDSDNKEVEEKFSRSLKVQKNHQKRSSSTIAKDVQSVLFSVIKNVCIEAGDFEARPQQNRLYKKKKRRDNFRHKENSYLANLTTSKSIKNRSKPGLLETDEAPLRADDNFAAVMKQKK